MMEQQQIYVSAQWPLLGYCSNLHYLDLELMPILKYQFLGPKLEGCYIAAK